MKAKLAARGVDYSRCVEKTDLRALWLRSFGPARRSLGPAGPAGPAGSIGPTGPAGPAVSAPAEDLGREVARIRRLRREAFSSAAAWGFAVLGVAPQGEASAAQAYRALMKRLHPDKAAQTDGVAEAAALVREAREAAEKGVSQLRPPDPPRSLRAQVTPGAGRRRILLSWDHALDVKTARVTRYLVAVLDPAYGRALTVAQLEPDYNQALGRFQPIDELTAYTLAEEELHKMPRFWQQQRAKVQVAACNTAGPSRWATVEAALRP